MPSRGKVDLNVEENPFPSGEGGGGDDPEVYED